MMQGSDQTLILLGGEIRNESLLAEHVASAARILAADGAAEFARVRRIGLHSVIGDFDSITPQTLEFYREAGVQIIHRSDQYSNDFEKALHHAISLGCRDVEVFGISGGRLDHTLTNLSVMRRFADQFDSLIAFDDSSQHFFLTKLQKQHSFAEGIGTRVSLSPMETSHGVQSRGLQYPLNDASMIFGWHEGLSNVIIHSPASVSIRSGGLLVSIELPSTPEASHG